MGSASSRFTVARRCRFGSFGCRIASIRVSSTCVDPLADEAVGACHLGMLILMLTEQFVDPPDKFGGSHDREPAGFVHVVGPLEQPLVAGDEHVGDLRRAPGQAAGSPTCPARSASPGTTVQALARPVWYSSGEHRSMGNAASSALRFRRKAGSSLRSISL